MKISVVSLECAMLEHGIVTYSALAERMGASAQFLSNVKNRGTCAPATLAKIAAALDIDPAELIATDR